MRRSVANFSKSLIGGHTNHRNGEEWTGMEQEWTEMEHFLLKINNYFNHDTLKCN